MFIVFLVHLNGNDNRYSSCTYFRLPPGTVKREEKIIIIYTNNNTHIDAWSKIHIYRLTDIKYNII